MKPQRAIQTLDPFQDFTGHLRSEVAPESRDGYAPFIAGLFGKAPALPHFNWTLKHLRKVEEGRSEAEHIQAQGIAARLANISTRLGINTVYAPDPSAFNGQVVPFARLTQVSDLGDSIRLLHGVQADGIILPRKSACAFSIGGCPVIVVADSEIVVVAHAGLRCLLRWDDPTHVSVVENVAEIFRKRYTRPFAWILFSIRMDRYVHSLTDPQYKQSSERIVGHLRECGYQNSVSNSGCIDLPLIIAAQLQKHGFMLKNTGQNKYLPSSAYDTRWSPPHNHFRNLIVVART